MSDFHETTPIGSDGDWTMWLNRETDRYEHEYVLRWTGNHGQAHDVAVWTATAIDALIAAQSDPDKLTERPFLDDALRDITKLQRMLSATADELLWAARGVAPGETEPSRDPLLSWKEIAGFRDDQNRSTPQRRFEALRAGARAVYANRFPRRGAK